MVKKKTNVQHSNEEMHATKDEIIDVLKTSCQDISVKYLVVRRSQLKIAVGDNIESIVFSPDDDGKSDLVKVKRVELLHDLEKPASETKKETKTKPEKPASETKK